MDCRNLDVRSLGGEISLEHLLLSFYKRLIRHIAEDLQLFAKSRINVGVLEKIFGGDGASRLSKITTTMAKLNDLLDEGL